MPLRSEPATRNPVRALVLCAFLLCTALVLGLVERWFPLPLPGARLGLGNACVLLCLMLVGKRAALMLLVARALLTAMLGGAPTALFYSLCGGLCAFAGYALLLRIGGFSPLTLCVAGATLHNAAQVGVAMLLTSTPELIVYFTPLGALGIISGLATGTLVRCALPAASTFLATTGVDKK